MRNVAIGFAIVALLSTSGCTGGPAKPTSYCAQDEPCIWTADVDAGGLYNETLGTSWAFTLNDWYVLNVTNLDAVAHTVSLDGYGLAIRVDPNGASSITSPFQFARAGSFTLRDDAGHTGQVLVLNCDAVDYSQGVVDANCHPRSSS